MVRWGEAERKCIADVEHPRRMKNEWVNKWNDKWKGMKVYGSMDKAKTKERGKSRVEKEKKME